MEKTADAALESRVGPCYGDAKTGAPSKLMRSVTMAGPKGFYSTGLVYYEQTVRGRVAGPGRRMRRVCTGTPVHASSTSAAADARLMCLLLEPLTSYPRSTSTMLKTNLS